MRFSSVFVATVAAYLSTSVAARAVPAGSQLEARKKCDPPSTVTVTVTGTSDPTSTDTSAPTETETESMPDPTSAPVPGGNGGLFDAKNFFPVPYKKAFTTLPKDAVQGLNASYVELSLDALTATHISGKVTQDVVDAPSGAPSGTKAFQAKYPKGSYNPTGSPRGGFGFYLGDPASVADFSYGSATEMLFSYAVYFPEDFDWVKGGKIPGAYGGASDEDAYGCSGGRQEGRDKCFSLRMMWRTDGMGEVYAYVPKTPENDKSFNALEGTKPDGAYGFSVARGAYTYKKGAWTVLAERVKLNTVGQADGEIELFVNGESKIFAKNVIIRQHEETTFKGFHFQTFFGGSNAEWATPKDVETHFAGVSAAIIA